MMHQYKIGKEPPQWSDEAQTITFIVTEDCNLRCKYCCVNIILTISKIKGLSTLARILRRPNADESADRKACRRQERGI